MSWSPVYYKKNKDIKKEAISILSSGNFLEIQKFQEKYGIDISIYIPFCFEIKNAISLGIYMAYIKGDLLFLEYMYIHLPHYVHALYFCPETAPGYSYKNFDKATRLLLKMNLHIPDRWYFFIVLGAFRLRSDVLLELIDRKSNITDEFLSKYKIDRVDAWNQIEKIDDQILSHLSVSLIPDLGKIVLAYIW